MKKFLIAIGAVVVLVVLAAVIVPLVVPVETYKDEILSQVRAATGREARIDGELSLSILPRVEIVAGKMSFANAPGGKASNMVELDRLTVRIALFPLIGGNVEIDAFVLEKPVINLEIDKAGRPNWQLKTAKAPAKAARPAEPAAPKTDGESGFGLSGLKLGDVRVVDGRISYFDARTGARQQADGINLTVSLPSLDSPMNADGSVVWNREKIALAVALSNPNAFLSGRRTDIEVQVAAAPVKLTFRGSAARGKTMKLGGTVDLDVPSIRRLAAWTGAPLDAPGSGYGPLKIAGKIDINGNWIAFRNARFSVDKINGTGDFIFDGRRRKPSMTAKLKLDKLDLNPYLPPERNGTSAAASRSTAAAGGAAPKPPKPSDWSDDPIDLSALNSVNAELDLTVGGLVMRKIKIGETVVKVTLKNGVLVTELARMALYGGTGRAKLTANAGGKVPAVALSFDLANFQANPFMSDAMDIDRIEGTANADLSVTTRGRSQRQMVSALNGAGKVKFLNGAIRGVNLAAMVRNIKTAFLDPGAREVQKTDFAELGGTYRISRGIVTNNDLLLKSPLLRLTGKGTVDLPRRRVNYRIEPKVVASVKGQGGAAGASGIKVPVIVQGPWNDLSYRPDLAGAIGGIAKDPGKALESVKDLLPGMPGGGTTESAPSPSPASNPLELLKGLFGR